MQQRFESFVTGMTVCYKHIQRIKSTEMTELGLKGTHAMCLFFLDRYEDGLTAAELCRLCNEDKAAISRSLATLREKNYICGEGKAYRVKWQLTEDGQRLSERVGELVAQWVGFGGEGLSDEDRDTFYRVLEHISTNLRNKYDNVE